MPPATLELLPPTPGTQILIQVERDVKTIPPQCSVTPKCTLAYYTGCQREPWARSFLFGFIRISLMVDGPQRARLPITLPSYLWPLRIIPSLPGSRLTNFYRDASSALLQNSSTKWLNFTYSRSHSFRYRRQNKNIALTRIELTTSALLIINVNINRAGVRGYLLDHSGDEGRSLHTRMIE